ncbi:MAG: ATP-binding cassette domain-containing protein [Phascolarctobacterium sp.]|nr:ATP-binding cassette domain-containing protein [Phascolarctobacterium sp.]
MINAVEIRNLTKKFGDITALDGLSLNIEKGKITGLIGADGAGKTTLSRTIIGLLVPDAGEISVLGFNPATQKNDLIVHIGYMPQKFGLYEDLSVLENLILYADLKDVPHDFDKMLEFTSLTTFQNRLAGDLSGGMKQKLGLACTLLGNPAFLVLDEPSVGVDPISRRDLMRMVREMMGSETTVLWSTAYLDEAHSFDTSVVIDKGKIIYDGIPSALGATAQEFQDKVIELMGGYKEEESQIAKNYRYRAAEVDLTVEADNLAKRYGDFYAVKNNTLKIKKGEIFGLIGPNGAGKSTSFKMMCGLARPTEGTARIMGIDIRTDPERARSNLGYMAQKFSLYGTLTVEENLEFFGAAYGIGILDRGKRIDDIMEIFSLKEYADQKSEDLPLGLKQRLSMACALIHNPPILFLDEPTSGVDVRMRRGFWNHITSLAKKGVTVMVTTHFMDEAEYCDRISLFYHGETIAIGTPAELKEKAGATTMEDAFINLIKESEKQ